MTHTISIGSKVSYGDMANPRKTGIVTRLIEKDPNIKESTFLVGAGMKEIINKFEVTFENHKSDCSETELDGPGGWELEEGIATEAEIAEIKEKLEKHLEERNLASKKASEKAAEEEARGKALIEKEKPEWAKAVILAEHDVDDSDIMTDYFSHTTDEVKILAWSRHTRDLFPEMRKAALTSDIPEIKALGTPSEEDGNGDARTERNKEWWHPSDEHREKYSMGHGFYLKKRHTHSTGWSIRKMPLADWYINSLYRSAGKEGVFCIPGPEPVKEEGKEHAPGPEGGNGNGGAKVGSYKGHPTITLPNGHKRGFTFGKAKAKMILAHLEEIKDFAESS